MAQQVGDAETLRGVESLFSSSESTVILALRCSKSQASGWNLTVRRRLSSKPRILAVTASRSDRTQKFKVKIHIVKQERSDQLKLSKSHKLKHLVKISAVQGDNSGCSFVLHFDNAKPGMPVPQWTTRNVDDRNKLLVYLDRLCKENGYRSPQIMGMDVVEISLWAQAHAPPLPASGGNQAESNILDVVTTEKVMETVGPQQELVSVEEETGMEELLDTYVMGIDEAEAFNERLKRELAALEAANVHAILEGGPLVQEVLAKMDDAAAVVNDMDAWLDVLNVKLKHMREDIESIEHRNNQLEMQAQNNVKLMDEVNRLLGRLMVPQHLVSVLTANPFDEPSMPRNIEACEWLTMALAELDGAKLIPQYRELQAVREKKAELEKLRELFVQRATDTLRSLFTKIAEFMLSNKAYFSERGTLRKPDHSELRYRCRVYARLLQHLKELDKSALPVLRKAYCHSVNLLLRREAREFVNEVRIATKMSKSASSSWLDGSSGSSGNLNSPAGGADSTAVAAEALSKVLRTFIPLLEEESSFFASFLCFDIMPAGEETRRAGRVRAEAEDDDALGIDDISPMTIDTQLKGDLHIDPVEQRGLSASLNELMDGVQEDFIAAVDWACKGDPLHAIALRGLVDKWQDMPRSPELSVFIVDLLKECDTRLISHFEKFVEDAQHQIGRYDKGVKQVGVATFLAKYAAMADRMEKAAAPSSRAMVDAAHNKLVGAIFHVLERIAAADPKHGDVYLLENHASFQIDMYGLATQVVSLGLMYQKSRELYDQAVSRYISEITMHQFGRLFQFVERLENMLVTIGPDEVPFQVGFSKVDLRRLLKSNLGGVDKQLVAMNKRMRKHLTLNELMPTLWEKCQEDFLKRYNAMEQLFSQCYPSEPLNPSAQEVATLFQTV